MAICVDSVYRRDAADPPLDAAYVLMTRFNLVLPFGVSKFRGRTSLQSGHDYDRWLAARVHLFETFCLPSVLQQVKRPDLWLLGFSDEGSAAPLLGSLTDHPWIVPCWQRHSPGWHEYPASTFQRALRGRIDPQAAYVVSTRLDSDDALGSSFLAYLARYASAVARNDGGLDDFWISFPTGMQYVAGECRLFNCVDNHFLSRVQRNAATKSGARANVYEFSHGKVFHRGRIFLCVTEEPMWVEHIHGGNVTNHLRNRLPRFASTARLLATCGVKVSRAERLRRWLPSLGPAAWRSLRRGVKKRLRAAGLMKPSRAKKA